MRHASLTEHAISQEQPQGLSIAVPQAISADDEGVAGKDPTGKLYEPRFVTNAIKALKEYVEAKHGGVKAAAAEALGVSESRLSRLLSEDNREGQPNIKLLIALRLDWKERSLDEILGLPPLPPQKDKGETAPEPAANSPGTPAFMRRRVRRRNWG